MGICSNGSTEKDCLLVWTVHCRTFGSIIDFVKCLDESCSIQRGLNATSPNQTGKEDGGQYNCDDVRYELTVEHTRILTKEEKWMNLWQYVSTSQTLWALQVNVWLQLDYWDVHMSDNTVRSNDSYQMCTQCLPRHLWSSLRARFVRCWVFFMSCQKLTSIRSSDKLPTQIVSF